MTTLIASGMTLRLGSGAIIQGGSVQAPPAYVAFTNVDTLARYTGTDNSTPVWTTDISGTGLSLGIDIPNQKIFVGDSNDTLTKIDATTGAVDWTVDVGDFIDGPKIAVDENGHAYVSFRGNSGALATKKINGSNANTIWSSSTSYSNGRSTVYSQAQGAVYVCHLDAYSAGLVKYNASTGVEIWKKTASDILTHNGGPSNPSDGVLLPNGNIALAAAKNYFVLNASTGAQVVKANLTTGDSPDSIVADSTHVFINSNNALYSFEHNGTNSVRDTDAALRNQPLGYRATKDQPYVRNGTNSTVLPLSTDNSSLTTGSPIGPYTRGGKGWPIIFLD